MRGNRSPQPKPPVSQLARWVSLTCCWLGLLACQPQQPLQAELTVAEALANADTAGFARATGPIAFQFPRDHGPHPDFQTEWWYFTGNLATADGRRFGYQLTFFRSALGPPAQRPARTTRWAAGDLYLAHFAVTDVQANQFHAREELQRGALGLAGMDTLPLRVFVGGWEMQAHTANDLFPLTLQAQNGPVKVRLQLATSKPYVLQGDRGFSPKSQTPGNASYYYSGTRLPTSGTITVGDDSFQVTGASWLDREWSTSALAPNQIGWDWFALQLSDTTELMYYQLRQQDGSADPASKGSFVSHNGSSQTIQHKDLTLTVEDWWTHPRSQVRYPARWRIQVPTQQLDLRIQPLIPDQELPLRIRYWEGAVRVQGTRNGKAVNGYGYVELTGYGDQSARKKNSQP